MLSRIPQTQSTYSHSSSRSNYTDGSNRSLSTAPTVHSEWIQQYKKIAGNPHDPNPRLSAKICASTTSSIEDLDDDIPPFEVPETSDYLPETLPSRALVSSPEEFSEYFPSTQKLSIRHDDTTMDGNMNLRIDTKARTLDGGDIDLQLFHLRMHDLKGREFSLRRYSRDSGREVCHSNRKYTKPSVMRRPGLQRSISNTLSSLRSKSESRILTTKSFNMHDSGNDSTNESDLKPDTACHSPRPSSAIPIPTNTMQLEFSNYTHLEVKRRGTKMRFEYWGTKYVWGRTMVRSSHFEQVSYHLVNTKTSVPLAHIIQVPLSGSEQRAEAAKGGWVPSCIMFLEDTVLKGSSDLADVVMASGLLTLVDDCIKASKGPCPND